MKRNTEERKIRIKNLAQRYADGYISLQDFYESELREGDDIRAHEQKRLKEMVEEAERERLQREATQLDPSHFAITKEEFRKLSLRDQMKLLEERPEEIRELLGVPTSSRITKEEYERLSHGEQARLNRAIPDQIRALENGSVDFVDIGGMTK